jgi:hypothetical protein
MLQADVRLEISLPEDLSDVNQLVAVAQQLLRQIGVAVLSQLLVQVQEQQLEAVLGPRWSEQPQREAPWECPDCGSNYDFQRRGSRERERLRTGVGDVAFDLLQVTCQRCGKTFSPFAGLLNLERWQQSTTELQAQVVALPLEQGYGKALQASGNRLMSTVSAMTAHRWVQEKGQQVQIAPSDDWEGATLLFDGTKVKAGDNPRGVAVRLGIAVLGRDEKHGRPCLQTKLVAFGVNQPWRELLAPLQGTNPERVLYDGEEDLADALREIFPQAKRQRCLWHLPRNLYWALYQDGWRKKQTKGWQKAVGQVIHHPDLTPQEAIRWMRKIIAQLRRRGGEHGAAYLETALDETFTYRQHPEGLFHDRTNAALGQAMIATSPVERQMRELNRRTDIGARWSIPGVRHLLALRLTLAFNPELWFPLWNLPAQVPWLAQVAFQLKVRFVPNVNSL